jgi:hypothetical protein
VKGILLIEEGHVDPDEGGKGAPAHEAEIFPDGSAGADDLWVVDDLFT